MPGPRGRPRRSRAVGALRAPPDLGRGLVARFARSATAGISLLEVLIALTILLIGLYPIVETFRSGFRATHTTKEHAQATMLADSVLEEVRARVTVGLGRYYTLADSGTTVRQRAAAGAWKSVFEPLAEERKKVVSASPSEVSTYFRALFDGGPVTAAVDPIAVKELAAFSTEVLVRFDVDGAAIDSDGDGRAETDMAEVTVIVTWSEPGQGEKSVRLSSLFTREEFDRALEGS